MLDVHRQFFTLAAEVFDCWILLRPFNARAERFLERSASRYAPKPIDCKAETADVDVGGRELAGLVVSPELWPGAFVNKDLAEVRQKWRETMGPSSRFSVDEDETSPHPGALILGGRWVHADYDLKGIVLVGHESATLTGLGTLHGVPHSEGPCYRRIVTFINGQLDRPMIQHGADDLFRGAGEGEPQDAIEVFKPQGGHERMTPSQVEALYSSFPGKWGRRSIDMTDNVAAFKGEANLSPAQHRARFH